MDFHKKSNWIQYDNGPWIRLPDYPLPPLPDTTCPVCGIQTGIRWRRPDGTIIVLCYCHKARLR